MGEEKFMHKSEFISKSFIKNSVKENAENNEDTLEFEKPLVLPNEF